MVLRLLRLHWAGFLFGAVSDKREKSVNFSCREISGRGILLPVRLDRRVAEYL